MLKIGNSSKGFQSFRIQYLLIFLIAFSSSCAYISKHNSTLPRGGAEKATTTQSSENSPQASKESSGILNESSSQVAPGVKQPLKLGLILGPGGVRAMAHAGVLQELHRNQILPVGIVGIEWGALVAAYFSDRADRYTAEWQLGKLKEEQIFHRGVLNKGSSKDLSEMKKVFEENFSSRTVESARIPMACPSFNLSKQKVYWMIKGPFVAMLPYCLPSPGLWLSTDQSSAHALDYKSAVDFLRKQGANRIVLVNVLPASDRSFLPQVTSPENQWWSLASLAAQQATGLMDFTLQVKVDWVIINDLTQRKNALTLGQQAGKELVQWIQAQTTGE